MGFFISEIHDTKLGAYIGSATLHAVADAGAFDTPLSKDGEKVLNENERVFVVVEKSGIEHCLNIIQTKSITGRDVQLLTSEIKQNYRNGFKITG